MIAICSIGATLFFGGYREFWFLSNTVLSVDRTPWLGPIYIFLKIFILLERLWALHGSAVRKQP